MKCEIRKEKWYTPYSNEGGYYYSFVVDGERVYRNWGQHTTKLCEYGSDGKELIVVFNGWLRKFPLEIMDKFKEFLKLGEFDIKEKKYKPAKYVVQDFMNDMNVKGSYSIGYRETATLRKSHRKEVVACIKSYNNGLVIFRKRGGYLAYRLFKTSYCNKFNVITLREAIADIKMVKENKLGQIYWESKKVKDEILQDIFVENI